MTYIHVFTSLLSSPRSSDIPGARNMPIPRSYFQYHLPVPYLEKWLILTLREGMFKMSLEYFVLHVPENKEVLKTYTHNKGTWEPNGKRSQWPKLQ